MTQQIVPPEKIEEQLQHFWEKLLTENKMRASTFNLIVFCRLSSRIDYFRNIVQKVIEKFPCRILFISEDPEATQPYLKTAVSVLFPQEEIACDQIDIGVTATEIERVPFVILPHLLPDLPIYLLWGEDPSKDHSLFTPLLKLSTRVIFDSENTDSLLLFAQKLLSLKQDLNIDIADLNWARTEGWRSLLTSAFDSKERLDHLYAPSQFTITYNEQETPFFCHLKTQALYLFSWLSSRLSWNTPQITIDFKTQKWTTVAPGAILSTQFHSVDEFLFEAKRETEDTHRVKIEISTKEKCELPFYYALGQTAIGQSLVKEICTKGTSHHFLGMLQQLDKDRLC